MSFIFTTIRSTMNCQLCKQTLKLRDLYTKAIPFKDVIEVNEVNVQIMYFCYSCVRLIDEYRVGDYSDHVLQKLEQANKVIQAYFNETTLKNPKDNCTVCLAPLYHECTSGESIDFDISHTCKTCILREIMTSN